MTKEHSHPGPSSIRDDSICESSLPPNKSSGDIGELKPCPFCGPGNSIVECYQDDYGGWRVGCGRCGSHSGFRPKSDPDARAKVIANWNKRPAESAAEIERLRRELAEAKSVLTDPAAFHLHALRTNVLSRMNALHIAGATDYDSLKSRALTAESAVAAAWEEAAKIAERCGHKEGVFTAIRIASAIRAAVSKKTAED